MTGPYEGICRVNEQGKAETVWLGLMLVVFMLASGASGAVSEIEYVATDLGGGSWQYTYAVSNISLAGPIEEFTIYFDYGLYENLSLATPDPPASDWDEIVVQPEPVLSDDGFYDALTLDAGIGVGDTVSGFAVSFDWLGSGEPGSQAYEIVEPGTLATIDSGWTVPEPVTLLMLGVGGVWAWRRQRGGRR